MKSLAKRLVGKQGPSSKKRATQAALMAHATAVDEVECQREWGLTLAQENQLVEQLRDEIEIEAGPLAPEWDNYVLRRFLRARKHNIPKAKSMFLDNLSWRKKEAVDTVLTDFEFQERDQFAKYYPEAFYGVDRAGRPVYVQQPGKIDTTQLWKFTTLERCVRYHIQQQERYWRVVGPACSLATGRLHEQSLVLIDMDGVGISTLTGEVRKIMSLVMTIDQDYYPELMWKCMVINAPTTFRVIWGMVKYLMDTRTQAKIEVHGTDYKEELLKLVAPENLPQCYGGTSTLPLSASPGPWQDPAVLRALERRRQRRVQEVGRPPAMTWPPAPPAPEGEATEDEDEEAADGNGQAEEQTREGGEAAATPAAGGVQSQLTSAANGVARIEAPAGQGAGVLRTVAVPAAGIQQAAQLAAPAPRPGPVTAEHL